MKALSLTALVLLLAGCAPLESAEQTAPLDEVDAPAPADPAQDAWTQCFDQRNAVLRTLSEMASARAGGCETDADCTLVWMSLPCQSACEAPMASAKVEELKAALAAYAAEVCPTLPTTCSVGPSCAHYTPVCRSGTCRTAF
ncbi:hypothetical protein FGE12_26470 [Aggregicoccus sp. 17bor-14]|uniref:hypothetical protein n=1 Tax=Myxococcaceae TaxID=31 RepID=UPI00129D14C8|nr:MULTISPECIES: hypothetical protein [Myxococcaceae]MBF5045985.1 hypothetical protein [Simulacricoccus sp. 17bor-14]MRI91716.1 hypothetical protein [Aggregicoccus sp. 17bor-14]